MTYTQKAQILFSIVIVEVVFIFATGININITLKGVLINFLLIGIILNIDNYIKFYKGIKKLDSNIDEKIAAFNERQDKKEAAKNENKN